jgi:hypothetical protein
VVEGLRERELLSEREADRWRDCGHVGDKPWKLLSRLDRTYPRGALGITWDIERRRPYLRGTLIAAAILATLGSAVLTYLDLTDPIVTRWLAQHNWTNQVVGSLVVVLATYVIVDRVLDRRRSARWIAVSERPILRYVRQLAVVRELVYEIGLFSLSVTSSDPPQGKRLDDQQQELRGRRAELDLRISILTDAREGLELFFAVAPELMSLLTSQLEIDRYLSMVKHSLERYEDPALELVEVEGLLSGWPAFRDAFNLHILAFYDLFGPSDLDDLFEEPRSFQTEWERFESRRRQRDSEGLDREPDGDIPF